MFSEKGEVRARSLVLATGGRSLPRSGSDGFGYELARGLGHSVTPTAPALVPLVLDPHPFAELAGVAFPAEIAVAAAGRRLATVQGSALVTHHGLSGPAALDVSRQWTAAVEPRPRLGLSAFPGLSRDDLERRWLAVIAGGGRRGALALLGGLPERLARRLCELAAVDPARPLAALDREGRRRLADAATSLALPVAGTRGWNEAEVTAGGVPLGEIDPRTMESRIRPGLYLAGEILDVDGRIGGFNFQWAWASGFVAGTALAGRSLTQPR